MEKGHFSYLKAQWKCTIVVAFMFLLICRTVICAGETTELTILHTNDFHGALLPGNDMQIAPPPEKVGGAAYIASKIKELRNADPDHVFLIDAGDCAMGTSLSNTLYGIPVIDYMNLMGYDAMALGNHEFEWGAGKLIDMAARAKFPFLAANLIDSATGRVPRYAKPYVILEKGGLKIGLIGLLTPNTTVLQNPNRIKNLLFLPPENSAEKAIEELQQKGIRVIIVVSHLGFHDDRALARKVSGVACIIGGHSHTTLLKPEKVRNTVIVQAGSNGGYLGRVKLTLDRYSGRVMSYSGELIPIIDRNIPPDKAVLELLAPCEVKIRTSMAEVLGIAKGDLPNRPLGDSESTPLGNFVTDALRFTCKADIALYKSDGLRADIPRGPVSRGALYQVLPFDNKVKKAELKGHEIKGVLEFMVESPFLTQVSGLSITYHGDREKGKRIEAAFPDGESIKDDKSYSIATVDYLFYLYYKSGGFDIFTKKHRTEVLSREIVGRYLSKQKQIEPSREHRVRKIHMPANPAPMESPSLSQ
jgi:5'-nucleotidase / UDP-sugar diphosphatase